MPDNGIDPLTFPGYRLIVELGSGRNGTVYRARELETQRLAALKVYRPEILRRAGFVSGLDSAVLAARSFKHPAAAAVVGLVEAKRGGSLGLVMELVGGEVLSRALQRNVRFSVTRAMRLARDLADVTAAAHAAKLVCGVLHPGHVVIYGESAKMLGIGWSPIEGLPAEYDHQPDQGRFAPAAYAAPEILSGARPDPASDVFSLGAVLYHMLTGLVPFKATDLPGLKLERTEGLRWPRGADSLIPPEAIGLVGRALELDPAFRPDAHEISAAAARILSGRGSSRSAAAGQTVPAAPDRPVIQATAEILPTEPGASPAYPPEPRASGSRLRDMLLGALAATVFIAAGLFLGRAIWGGQEGRPEPTPPEPPDASAGPGETARPPVPEPPKTDPVRREWEAIVSVLEEEPADLGPVKERLAGLIAKHGGTRWGLLAKMKLNEIHEAEKTARLAAFRKLVDAAGKLEAEERFGAAMKLYRNPPSELAGTELAVRCTEKAKDLWTRAAERFVEISKRAERSAADGDLPAAVADYQYVIDRFGVSELVERARKRIREIGEEQERIAARSAEEKERVRREAAAKRLGAGLKEVRAAVSAFKYDAALAAAARLKDDADQEAMRPLLIRYAEMITAEKALFQRACKRVKEGVKELTIAQGGAEVLHVRKVDATGLTAGGGGGVDSLLFRWDRIPEAQIYRAFKLTIDVTNGEEHLALATFAWHRGQRLEMENGLKLAVELEADLKDRAKIQSQVYAGVDAVLMPRRTGSGEGTGLSPRRGNR
ncbi:MAG: serine/threonine protein kinase [Planctomycetota bacterium]|jgi:hypothetical protein